MNVKSISHNLLLGGAYRLSPQLEYEEENLKSNCPIIRGDSCG